MCLTVKRRRIKVTLRVKFLFFFSLMYELLKVTRASRFVLALVISSGNKIFPSISLKETLFKKKSVIIDNKEDKLEYATVTIP